MADGAALGETADASEPRVAFAEKLAGVRGFGLERFTVGREESPMTDFAAEQSNEPD